MLNFIVILGQSGVEDEAGYDSFFLFPPLSRTSNLIEN